VRSHLASTYLGDVAAFGTDDITDDPTVDSPPPQTRLPEPPASRGGMGEITLPGGIRIPTATLVAILAAIAAIALILYLRGKRR
jgi:hypothetical protein